MAYGASMAGVDMGPAALRVARLNERIAQLGYQVTDNGDLQLERPRFPAQPGDKLKYLPEISCCLRSNWRVRFKRTSTLANFQSFSVATTRSRLVQFPEYRLIVANKKRLWD